MKYTKQLAFMLIAPAMIAPVAASGQEQAPNLGLEDIIVTAQKRSERLQDTPIAVTALTSAAIEAGRVDSTQDLQFSVPNLVFTSFTGNAQPYLRGIGSDITGANGDPSVATYIDGVYSAGTFQSIVSLLGVERVEVLKGPQGTLYGRNAVGGAINIHTLSPDDAVSARLSISAGNLDRKEANGHFSGPLSDTLSLGVYFAFRQRDSYMRQATDPRPSGEPDDETEWGVRVKAIYEPSDAVKLTAAIEKTKADLFDASALRQLQANATGFAQGAAPIIQRDVISSDGADYFKPEQVTGSLTGEFDLGFAQARSITAFHDFEVYASTDADATTAPIFTQPALPSRSKDFSQEFQLLSPADSDIKWIVGLFYLRQRTGLYPLIAMTNVLFPAPRVLRRTNSDILLHSYAAFGQISFPITTGLNLTLGGRYTSDEKRFKGDATFYDVNDNQVGATTFYGPYQKKWTKFNPKISVDYKIDDTLLYATFSQGFKSGVYASSNPASPGPANPENLTAYEVGVKTELFDRRVRINSAAYYYDFKDLQVQTINASTGGTVQIQNAARSRTYGFETEIDARLTDELTLEASGSYNHGRYRNFDDAVAYLPAVVGNSATIIDASGNHTIKSPKWTASGGVTYAHDFGNGDTLNGNARFAYNSGFYWDTANRIKQDAYTTVNASLGYTFSSSNITASIWGTNLFNKRYLKALTQLAYGTIAADAEPRMYGATLSWKM